MPIQIHDSVFGKFFVRITADNGRILASSSKVFERKAGAIKNAEALKKQLKSPIQDKTNKKILD